MLCTCTLLLSTRSQFCFLFFFFQVSAPQLKSQVLAFLFFSKFQVEHFLDCVIFGSWLHICLCSSIFSFFSTSIVIVLFNIITYNLFLCEIFNTLVCFIFFAFHCDFCLHFFAVSLFIALFFTCLLSLLLFDFFCCLRATFVFMIIIVEVDFSEHFDFNQHFNFCL